MRRETNAPVIEWKAPSPHPRRKHDWQAIADELRRHPGEWALVARDVPSSTPAHINGGRVAALRPAEHWQATVRGAHSGRAAELYVRYIGGES